MKENSIGIIGKSNTGKTRKILFNEVNYEIKKGNNLVIVDEKKEYYNHFKKELEDNGYTIKVINFNKPLESDGYEPLAFIQYLYNNDRYDDAIEQIKIMGKIIFHDEHTNDPFWENMATDYFIGIVLTLLRCEKENKMSFGSILNIINEGEKEYKATTYLKTFCESLDSMDPIYIALTPTLYAPDATKNSIMAVVKQKLNEFFMRSDLLKSFYSNYFHIEFLQNNDYEKLALFIINYNPIASLTNILINQVYIAIKDIKKMTFIIEGIEDLPKIAMIEEMINSANEGKIKLYASTRNFAKLQNKYPRYTFSNVETGIELKDKYETDYIDNDLSLPKLEVHNPEYFKFSQFIEKNY